MFSLTVELWFMLLFSVLVIVKWLAVLISSVLVIVKWLAILIFSMSVIVKSLAIVINLNSKIKRFFKYIFSFNISANKRYFYIIWLNILVIIIVSAILYLYFTYCTDTTKDTLYTFYKYIPIITILYIIFIVCIKYIDDLEHNHLHSLNTNMSINELSTQNTEDKFFDIYSFSILFTTWICFTTTFAFFIYIMNTLFFFSLNYICILWSLLFLLFVVVFKCVITFLLRLLVKKTPNWWSEKCIFIINRKQTLCEIRNSLFNKYFFVQRILFFIALWLTFLISYQLCLTNIYFVFFHSIVMSISIVLMFFYFGEGPFFSQINFVMFVTTFLTLFLSKITFGFLFIQFSPYTSETSIMKTNEKYIKNIVNKNNNAFTNKSLDLDFKNKNFTDKDKFLSVKPVHHSFFTEMFSFIQQPFKLLINVCSRKNVYTLPNWAKMTAQSQHYTKNLTYLGKEQSKNLYLENTKIKNKASIMSQITMDWQRAKTKQNILIMSQKTMDWQIYKTRFDRSTMSQAATKVAVYLEIPDNKIRAKYIQANINKYLCCTVFLVQDVYPRIAAWLDTIYGQGDFLLNDSVHGDIMDSVITCYKDNFMINHQHVIVNAVNNLNSFPEWSREYLRGLKVPTFQLNWTEYQALNRVMNTWVSTGLFSFINPFMEIIDESVSYSNTITYNIANARRVFELEPGGEKYDVAEVFADPFYENNAPKKIAAYNTVEDIEDALGFKLEYDILDHSFWATRTQYTVDPWVHRYGMNRDYLLKAFSNIRSIKSHGLPHLHTYPERSRMLASHNYVLEHFYANPTL